jgi:hypothetical protein
MAARAAVDDGRSDQADHAELADSLSFALAAGL